jgi:diguanylate cyclase (GGDEF)-like protein/PAS domain S-box-containing protein
MPSEKDYHALFDLAADAMFILDENRIILEINPIAHQQLGYDKSEMQGRPIDDFVPPEYLPMVRERHDLAECQGRLIYESAQLRRDGSALPVEICSRPITLDGRKAFLAVARDLSVRRQSALQQCDLRQAQSIANFGSWTHDLQGKITWSQELYKIFGVCPETYNPNTDEFYKLIHEDDLPAMKAWNDACVSGLKPDPLEYRCIRPDGEIRHIYGHGELMLDGEGRLSHLAGTVQDITRIKNAEEALRKSERNYRDILEQAGDAIMVADHEGLRYLEVNQAACDLFGYTREEFLRLGLADLSHPRDLPSLHQRLEQFWTGHVAHTERQLRRKDGSFVTVDMTSKMLEDGRLISIKRDITDRKIAENAMKRHQAIIKTARDGFWLTDMKGNLLEANQAYADMSGYTVDELVNLHISQLDAFESRDDVKARIRDISTTGAAVFETQHRRKDGSLFDVEVSVNYMPEQQQFVSFFRDISARKKNRERLETSLEFSNNLIRSMHDGFTILDKHTVTMDANPALCMMTGFSREELIGASPPFPYWPPEEHDKINAAFLSSLQDETSDFELTFMHKEGRRFPVIVSPSIVRDKDGNIANHIATIKDISERKEAEKKIEHLAYHDQLTGLPNRTLLLDRLKQALVSSERHGWSGALLFIDIDNFKNLNDTLGHDVGDMLLKEVASRLESCVREGDTVARLGGDEFVVMLLELDMQALDAAAHAESIGEKILSLLRQPHQLGNHPYHCTASIGITLFDRNHQTMEELMKQADITMYQSKKSGRNTLRFFDRRMQESIDARVSMENELRRALAEKHFVLHYQIQINSAHQALGAEALIRWVHPERGVILPEEFIPLAEETGLIIPIGQWVLETACAQIGAWQQDPITKNLTLSVNVSARQFREADFASRVKASIERHGIDPARLKIELTESLLQENIDQTIATMNTLNELGVQFSLDDFGTGYSSLQYLKRLPLNQIKIDRSFVHDITTNASDKAIVYTIIAMAQGLNLNVIAEGVEVEAQREMLLNRSCTNYQGYLFGKPVPIDQFEVLLQR